MLTWLLEKRAQSTVEENRDIKKVKRGMGVRNRMTDRDVISAVLVMVVVWGISIAALFLILQPSNFLERLFVYVLGVITGWIILKVIAMIAEGLK